MEDLLLNLENIQVIFVQKNKVIKNKSKCACLSDKITIKKWSEIL